MLDKSETEEIKKQIIGQIERTFPLEQKEKTKKQIEEMTSEELEDFLIKNNLIKNSDKPSQSIQKSPFRMIVHEEIPSYKIEENEDALAVLEINPVSKGHIIIIPKEEIFETDKVTEKTISLAKSLSQKLKEKLTPTPKEVSIYTTKVLGEVIINLIPVYNEKNSENLDSERDRMEESELKETQKTLTEETIKKEMKKNKENKIEENLKQIRVPRRIP